MSSRTYRSRTYHFETADGYVVLAETSQPLGVTIFIPDETGQSDFRDCFSAWVGGAPHSPAEVKFTECGINQKRCGVSDEKLSELARGYGAELHKVGWFGKK